MKRFIYYTLLCCVALTAYSCSHSDELDGIKSDDGRIVISTSLASSEITRAADTSVERTVSHIDIFAVKSEGANVGKIVHYERNTVGNNSGSAENGAGELTLNVKRGDAKFEADQKYTFYMVANATADSGVAAGFSTLEDLEKWLQSDALLHATGTKLGGGNPPQFFLMQAVAGVATGQVVNSTSGNSDNLALTATFERAASKIVVNIKQGDDVEFYKQLSDGSNQGNALYYFNMLPTKTYVLPENSVALSAQTLVTTADLGPNANTYIWTEAAGHTAATPKHDIQLVGYAYAHNWSTATPLEETCLIVNIPIKWNRDGDDATGTNGMEVTSCNSWYMIPLSEQEKFERNKCYVVNLTINTAGADDRTSVVEMEGIEFNTLEWQDVEISVGETGNDPKYLTLNTNLVKIYNTNVDNTQLSFSSSSPIKGITLKDIDDAGFPAEYRTDGHRAYYKDKFGNIQDLTNAILNTISATAQANILNGPITINSTIVDNNGNETHYNTIRYLEFEVENEQGLKADFRVEQYPVIYITNEQGYFSYRDDFIAPGATTPTHYLNRSSVNLTTAYWASTYIRRRVYNNWVDVDDSEGYATVAAHIGNNSSTYYADGKQLTRSGNNNNNSYYYEYTESGTTYRKYFSNLNKVFSSGVVREVYTSGNNKGKSDIDEYRGGGNNWSFSDNGATNQRMYHVHVTATSGDYTIARPRIVDDEGNPTSDVENGHTDDRADNARLVSPSFMIASQLGVTYSASSVSDSTYARAVNQCKNYVETHFEDLNNNNAWDTGEPLHHYRDWRLPTAEEIRIIAELQGKAQGAVDMVLAGLNYFCASPNKYVIGNKDADEDSDGYYIRCIRDAY